MSLRSLVRCNKFTKSAYGDFVLVEPKGTDRSRGIHISGADITCNIIAPVVCSSADSKAVTAVIATADTTRARQRCAASGHASVHASVSLSHTGPRNAVSDIIGRVTVAAQTPRIGVRAPLVAGGSSSADATEAEITVRVFHALDVGTAVTPGERRGRTGSYQNQGHMTHLVHLIFAPICLET
jgi:hypothetical protein